MKFNLRKLYKATLVGVASLALIVPLVGNTSTSVFAADSKQDIQDYEWDMSHTGSSMLSDTEELYLIVKHPALRNTNPAKYEMQYNLYWGNGTWDFYARHFKRLYSPYLYKYMPKRDPFHDASDKRDNRILYRVQKQMGLLNRRSHRHAYHRVHHARRTRRNRRHRVNRHRHGKRNVKHSRRNHKRNRR